jgi:hypothetical protein
MSFTLEDMEKLPLNDEKGDEEVVCEWAETDKADHAKKVKACTDQVFKCLFGKHHQNLSGHQRVTKILAKAFPPAEEDPLDCEDDLSQALDLLDDSLTLMERLLSQHPQLMGVDLIDQMEEIHQFISQWGMGNRNDGDKKITTINLEE